MDGYTIGQFAAAAGVPTSTIRFYERAGLVKPDFRTGGNYRGYGAAALRRLKFIRSAQATGLSLCDIESLLQLTFCDDPPCEQVLAMMRNRLEEIRKRVKELRHVEKVLAKSLSRCCKGDGPDLCDDIRRMKGRLPVACKPIGKKIGARA
ncbi:MAG TPA: MerR family transcriptional regulator [Tepidisphaeraceae bacterium]|nr:MerR family transcriptional regulator [Tepidisphaeraceae bacterium]